jgi:hypothetical protein
MGTQMEVEMERTQLHYFKILIGLGKKNNRIVIKGDLGLFSLRNKQLVCIVGNREKIIVMPYYWLTKMLSMKCYWIKEKILSLCKLKSILDNCGLSGWWNDDIRPYQ